jgi:hypothetical protein
MCDVDDRTEIQSEVPLINTSSQNVTGEVE